MKCFLMICKVYALGCRGINGLGRETGTIKGPINFCTGVSEYGCTEMLVTS